MENLKEFIELTKHRFIKYTGFWTASDRNIAETPSTPGQWDLAKALVEELRGLGINDISLTDHCYLIARLPASPGMEDISPVGFFAHLDTTEEVPGKDVKAILVENYDGKPIELVNGLCLDPASQAGLAEQKGRAIIHSDGSTLLGADDKAGIAVIMGAAEYLLAHPELAHGPLELIFTPDEETVRGLPEFPLQEIKAKAAYTLDGGGLGDVKWECFNAWLAEIKFTGLAAHVGAARGSRVSAALMASVYAAMLPRNESPESTDGYYGYYGLMSISGDVENASLELYIRDFDQKEGERRILALHSFAQAVEAQFPGGKVEVSCKVQYKNMRDSIAARPEVMGKVRRAMANLGLKGTETPIRACTDGSFLAELGIPAQNIFNGGRNFHSRLEWLSVDDMAMSCRLIVELIRLWTEKK